MPRVLPAPYLLFEQFLDEGIARAFLDYAIAHEAAFGPSRVGSRAAAKTMLEIRTSLATRELGDFRKVLKDAMRPLIGEWSARLGMPAIPAPKIELELAAHNDGAFYKRHKDTETASETFGIRVLSCVYYLHAMPQMFSGGALRLYAIGDPEWTHFRDIEPAHNTLAVFPAWVPHEVMPVGCPSGRFADSRFAVNCWIHRSGAAE